jgi:hypothetical protein
MFLQRSLLILVEPTALALASRIAADQTPPYSKRQASRPLFPWALTCATHFDAILTICY